MVKVTDDQRFNHIPKTYSTWDGSLVDSTGKPIRNPDGSPLIRYVMIAKALANEVHLEYQRTQGKYTR